MTSPRDQVVRDYMAAVSRWVVIISGHEFRLYGDKPLPELMLTYHLRGSQEHIKQKNKQNLNQNRLFQGCILKCYTQNIGRFVQSTLKPKHNGRHFADEFFKLIFCHQNCRILIQIFLKFISWVQLIVSWYSWLTPLFGCKSEIKYVTKDVNSWVIILTLMKIFILVSYNKPFRINLNAFSC